MPMTSYNPNKTTSGGYNIAPTPTDYNPAYGGKPGVVTLPPSLYQGIQKIYPGISGLTGGAGNVISSQLAGELSPETINAIQDQAASFGISTGMPLSSFAGAKGLKQLGLRVEDVQNTGTKNYLDFLRGLSGTADDPNLAAQLASWNATNLAAGIPEMIAKAAEEAYNRALTNAQGSVKPVSPGGGTIAPSFGGGGGVPSRGTLPSAYDTPSQIYRAQGPFLPTTSGMSQADLYNIVGNTYGGVSPQTGGTTYFGSGGFNYPDEFTPAFQPGDFSGINIGDYTPAGGGLPDFGAIYEAAGLPYVDYSNYMDPSTGQPFDWGIYE